MVEFMDIPGCAACGEAVGTVFLFSPGAGYDRMPVAKREGIGA